MHVIDTICILHELESIHVIGRYDIFETELISKVTGGLLLGTT